MTCDETVVLNCPKQRGLILISNIQQEGCSRRGSPCGSGGPQPSVLLWSFKIQTNLSFEAYVETVVVAALWSCF